MHNATSSASAPDAITIDALEAARLTGLSPKTLERRSNAGEPTGRVRVGRRVLFVKTQLEAWLRSLADCPAAIA